MTAGGSENGHETRRILRPMGPLFRASSAGEHSGAWERPDTGRHREPSPYWVRAEYVAPARPWWRVALAVLAVLIVTAAIIAAALHAGGAAADGFGPLIPQPTPAPGGWTP